MSRDEASLPRRNNRGGKAMYKIAGFLLMAVVVAVPSQSSAVSLGAGVGTGYMPMTKWQDFATSGPNSYYTADDLALYLDALARFRLARHHGLRVSYGRIFTSADWSIASPSGSGSGTTASVVEYQFHTAPFGVAYEYFFGGFENGSATFLGLGASVYFTTLESKIRELGGAINPPEPEERVGQGFGVEFLVGQRARVSDTFSLDVQLRGRWADGFLFSDAPEDVAVEFSGIDISVFAEWFVH